MRKNSLQEKSAYRNEKELLTEAEKNSLPYQGKKSLTFTLQLSASTGGQYIKAWRELYISLYLGGDTAFTRDRCRSFIKDTTSTRAIALC